MIAQAEGSYQPELADRVVTNPLSPNQTIHAASVNGLRRLSQLPPRQVREILTSPDWLRFTSTRNPLSRVYSAWGNRLLLRAPGHARRLADLTPDVVDDNQLDLTATFANFVQAFSSNTEQFMNDHHFMTQTRFIRPDLISYNSIVCVDVPGALTELATVLSARSAAGSHPTDASPNQTASQRLNEGLGIPLALVCDITSADILMNAYQVDYDTFGFSRDEVRSTLSPRVSPYFLSATETRLLHQLRAAIQRSLDIANSSRVRQRLSFRVVRLMYAVLHKASLRHIARPQRYM